MVLPGFSAAKPSLIIRTGTWVGFKLAAVTVSTDSGVFGACSTAARYWSAIYATALPSSAVSARSISSDVISHSFSKFATMARMKVSTAVIAAALSPR